MPAEGHGYIDYVGDEEHFWFAETLWTAAARCAAEEIPLDALPWRSDGCRVLGDPPTWGALADHCERAMTAALRFPIVVGPTGDILDGMHRLIRSAVEGHSTVFVARLSALPPPDRVRPRAGVWSLEQLRDTALAWAASARDIVAVALVGSYARGTPTADSDVDLIVLTSEVEARLERRRWLTRFGTVRSVQRMDYGAITSLTAELDRGPPIEFGLGAPGWAALARTDPATVQVVRSGFRPWYDPNGLLAGLPGEG